MQAPIRFLSVIALALCAGCSACAAVAFTSYHVGNSLTWDSQPGALQAFAASTGQVHEAGSHVHSGFALNQLLANPDLVNTPGNPAFGTYGNALPNFEWDAVTIQPFNGGVASNLATDTSSILSLIDLARMHSGNADTRFYIYTGWANQSGFRDNWLAELENVTNPPTERSRAYFNLLIENVRQQTDASVFMVPVGDVLLELDTRLDNSEVPGFSFLRNFFRDHIHLNKQHGRYLASLTTYSTIRNQSPFDIAPPEAYFGTDILTAEQQTALQSMISDVLLTHPYSGVNFPGPTTADFDQSGQVEGTDLQVWENSYGIIDPYDLNEDGLVNEDDRLIWEQNVTQYHAADFNADGRVNPLDFDIWQQSVGIDDGGDADDDGDTDQADRLIWEQANVPFSTADYNEDGLVDLSDLQTLRQSYGIDATADLTNDDLVDGADWLLFQRELTPYNLADKNADRFVDEIDFQHWERTSGYNTASDINENGLADGMELLAWQLEYGNVWPVPSGALASVPEPNAFLILTLAAFSLMLRRHRAAG